MEGSAAGAKASLEFIRAQGVLGSQTKLIKTGMVINPPPPAMESTKPAMSAVANRIGRCQSSIMAREPTRPEVVPKLNSGGPELRTESTPHPPIGYPLSSNGLTARQFFVPLTDFVIMIVILILLEGIMHSPIQLWGQGHSSEIKIKIKIRIKIRKLAGGTKNVAQ